ncbi:heme ABC transporter ATP-binding protein [Luteimicrobium subarcticum]|uniref:Iron complex transport system ATP-binding protein n=1 Tax=Luteimicrobium subarcticum TaxID=620910 RepID=A0A2M8WS10_9MICO|nr:heme ABC transporter ATP-binding protein [Luteimicrobium subarcticum]PJI93723.1 iron complex transport system ATP-binding protein [Luteimicrobium subarcticum]
MSGRWREALRPVRAGRPRTADDGLPPSSHPAGTLLAQVTGVRLERGGRLVLDDADLAVRAGEVHALLGPNGAGKSTLLGVLTGDLVPEAGTVTVDGREVGAWHPTGLARRRAVLLQQVTVSFPFTAEEIVRMGRAPWARTAAEDDDDDAVASAMAAVDVTHLAARTVPSLSGGERARVALARVLAQRTGVLLLDEPTAALDLGHQELVLQLAREHARAGGAVVVVVHDLGLAAAYADRVTVVSEGRVRACGPTREVLTASLLSDVWRFPVEVLEHPHGGAPLVVPVRAHTRATTPASR